MFVSSKLFFNRKILKSNLKSYLISLKSMRYYFYRKILVIESITLKPQIIGVKILNTLFSGFGVDLKT